MTKIGKTQAVPIARYRNKMIKKYHNKLQIF